MTDEERKQMIKDIKKEGRILLLSILFLIVTYFTGCFQFVGC
jgi:hypothetical protein